jgi:hypothetical protein
MYINFYSRISGALHGIKKNFVMQGILFFTVVIFLSCTGRQPKLEKLADDIAGYECRAVALRNQRFELADKIRFTQDTLLHFSGDTAVLHHKLIVMENNKQLLLTQSLQLADTISKKIDFIMSGYFNDKNNQKEFNQLLNEALKKRGCK